MNVTLTDDALRVWLQRMPAKGGIRCILELHGGQCKTSTLLEFLGCALKTLDNVLAIMTHEGTITVSKQVVSLAEAAEISPIVNPNQVPSLDPTPVPNVSPSLAPNLSPTLDPSIAPKSGRTVSDNQNMLGGDYRGGEVLLGSLNQQKQQSQSVETVCGGGSGGSEKSQPPKTRVPKPPKPPKLPKTKLGTAAAAWLEYLEENQTAPEWLDLVAWQAWLKDLDSRVPFKGSTIGRLKNHLQKLEEIHKNGQSQALAISTASGVWLAPYLPRDAVENIPNSNSSGTASQTPKAVPKHSFKDATRADVQLARLRAERAARASPDASVQAIQTVPARTVSALPKPALTNPQPGGQDNDSNDPESRHN